MNSLVSAALRQITPETSCAHPPVLPQAIPATQSPPVSRPAILQPGRNCWRIEQASRASVLVDGAAYFSNLEDALRQARHSVFILGWDFDGRIRLRQDQPDDASPPLSHLLRQIVEENEALNLYILVWSVGVIHAPGAPVPMLLGEAWQNHPRIHIRLDTHHPIYAAHHQKIVAIDGTLAFVGGIDLTVRRWDDCDHCVDHPHRLSPDRKPYPPVHDMQMVVDGMTASAVAELARARWRDATGETLAPDPADARIIWPAGLAADFEDTPVAIARTMPAYGGKPEVSEIEKLGIDALRAARDAIYIEAQYLTAAYIGDLLEHHLRRPDGPDVVVLLTYESRGLIERVVMGDNRDRLLRRLQRADRYKRLRACYPVVPKPDGHHPVHIHAKLMIVDDRFLRVGSANLNNRSVGLDTECDLSIEAHAPAERERIAAIRARLLGEHLGRDPQEVLDAIAREGRLIAAIDRLNAGHRGLRCFDVADGPARPAISTPLFDPKRPFFTRRRRRT